MLSYDLKFNKLIYCTVNYFTFLINLQIYYKYLCNITWNNVHSSLNERTWFIFSALVFACDYLRVSRWYIPPAVDTQQSIPREWDVELDILGVVNRNVKPPEESRRNCLDQLCPDSHLSPLYHPASLNHLFICQAKWKNETNILYVQFPWFIQRQKSIIKLLYQVFVMWICNISFKVLVHVIYSSRSKPA